MIKLMVFGLLSVAGLCLGSFVNALVWRLHKQAKQKKGPKSSKYSIATGRSMCPHCEHELAVKDLIPVASWISLRGRCRYCKKPIPDTPLPELLLPALFVWSYITWPYADNSWNVADIVAFLLWSVLLTGFMALALYDMRWQLLPDKILMPLTVIGAGFVGSLVVVTQGTDVVLGALIGGAIIFGLFYGLFALSDGKWIGGGDVKMGLLLGMLAGGAFEAFLLIFTASLLGTIHIVGTSAAHRRTIGRHTKLPFGPFLLLAAVIIVLYSAAIMDWYTNLLLPV